MSRKLIAVLFSLLSLVSFLGAQVRVSGKEDVNFSWIKTSSDEIGTLTNKANIDVVYTDDDNTAGAWIRIGQHSPIESAPSFYRAYGWMSFFDSQLKISAGKLYSDKYSIYNKKNYEDSSIFSSDSWELNGKNGIMAEFAPAALEGLSAAAVCETDNYDDGLGMLYVACRYTYSAGENSFGTLLTCHFDNTLANSVASAALGFSLGDSIAADVGVKYNMGYSSFDNNGSSLITPFAFFQYTSGRLWSKSVLAAAIDREGSAATDYLITENMEYKLTDILSLGINGLYSSTESESCDSCVEGDLICYANEKIKIYAGPVWYFGANPAWQLDSGLVVEF